METGPSPAVYGLLGALFVELLQTWKRLANRWWELAKLTLILIISLAAGLLPYIDNFAHLGGFVFGFLRQEKKKEKRKKKKARQKICPI